MDQCCGAEEVTLIIFANSLLLLVALTAVDFMLRKNMTIGLRKTLHAVWVVVFLVVALSMPHCSSKPSHDNEELADTAPY
jgi:hypothetical protein